MKARSSPQATSYQAAWKARSRGLPRWSEGRPRSFVRDVNLRERSSTGGFVGPFRVEFALMEPELETSSNPIRYWRWNATSRDLLWGELRSRAHALDPESFPELVGLLLEWPDSEEVMDAALPYVEELVATRASSDVLEASPDCIQARMTLSSIRTLGHARAAWMHFLRFERDIPFPRDPSKITPSWIDQDDAEFPEWA